MNTRDDGFSTLRPAPLDEAAGRVSRVVGTLSALVTALAGSGIAVLSAEQADALTALLGAVPGLVTLVAVALAAFRVRDLAKPEVTPVEDPRTSDGTPLVRAA
jgi:uncharacterized protein with von Willebrand factor type A (vWA) domain